MRLQQCHSNRPQQPTTLQQQEPQYPQKLPQVRLHTAHPVKIFTRQLLPSGPAPRIMACEVMKVPIISVGELPALYCGETRSEQG